MPRDAAHPCCLRPAAALEARAVALWRGSECNSGAGSGCNLAMACVLPLFVIHPVIRLTLQ